MQMTQEAGELLQETVQLAVHNGHEYVMPEHLLYLLTCHFLFQKAFEYCGGDADLLREQIGNFLTWSAETAKEAKEPQFTEGMRVLLVTAQEKARTGGRQETDVVHLVYALYQQPESFGVYYMRAQGVECVDLIAQMSALYGEEDSEEGSEEDRPEGLEEDSLDESEEDMPGELEEPESPMAEDPGEMMAGERKTVAANSGFRETDCPHKAKNEKKQPKWQRYAPCLNDMADAMNPLIGREEELERTIQILCRKEKNNPLHIGEPGGGKNRGYLWAGPPAERGECARRAEGRTDFLP